MGQASFFSTRGLARCKKLVDQRTMIARQILTRLLKLAALAVSWLQGLPVASSAAARRLAQTILQGDAAPRALRTRGYLSGTGTAPRTAFCGDYDSECAVPPISRGDAGVPN